MDCKCCSAPLQPAQVKCGYCGTVQGKSAVEYHFSEEKKRELIRGILESHIPAEDLQYGNESYTLHDCCSIKAYMGEQVVVGSIWNRRLLPVKTTLGIINFARISDFRWGDIYLRASHPLVNSLLEKVAEELAAYTKVELILA